MRATISICKEKEREMETRNEKEREMETRKVKERKLIMRYNYIGMVLSIQRRYSFEGC
jgi:hypothetical protein